MITDIGWLSEEARKIHDIFSGYFYLIVTVLMLIGALVEYFKWPLGQMPNFGVLVGRSLIAATLLHAYPEITNTLADITDAISGQLGDMNNFDLILDRMGDKVGELSWSWVSFKETIMLMISFITFFILYFSIHIADSFYIYVWVMLYVFSPILIALYVLPVTSSATSALFRSLFEVACWKIVWSVIATLLWSSALTQINASGSQISFLTAIAFNIILAGSLLLTPFVVHALAGGGLTQMGKDLGSLAIGGMTLTPSKVIQTSKKIIPFKEHRKNPSESNFTNKSKSNNYRHIKANEKEKN